MTSGGRPEWVFGRTSCNCPFSLGQFRRGASHGLIGIFRAFRLPALVSRSPPLTRIHARSVLGAATSVSKRGDDCYPLALGLMEVESRPLGLPDDEAKNNWRGLSAARADSYVRRFPPGHGREWEIFIEQA